MAVTSERLNPPLLMLQVPRHPAMTFPFVHGLLVEEGGVQHRDQEHSVVSKTTRYVSQHVVHMRKIHDDHVAHH